MDEPRLTLGLDAGPRNPSKKSQELTPVADAQAERVRALVESLELLQQPRVELYGSRPPLRGIQHIGVGEPADECGTSKVVEGYPPSQKV